MVRSADAAPASPGGRDIVCLGTAPWLQVHSVAEHTMLLLAREHRVLYVEPFNSWLTLRREAQWKRQGSLPPPGLRREKENFWVLTPPALGLPGSSRWRWPAEVNGVILAIIVRRALRRVGFGTPIVWTFLYNSATAISRLPAALTVYDCIDNDEALACSEGQRRLVRRHEERLCRRADLVFAVTKELAARRRAWNPRTWVVNCAADLEFFGQAAAAQTPVPPDIARLPKPVVGYLGGVDPWKMDIELLRHVARERPAWSIALVGYVWFGFDPAKLRGLPNVHLLGPRPYEQFPAYLKGMDVCIMPFPLNDITRYGDSLKCYEYLAGGKAVVSTPVPVAVRLAPAVRVAETPGTFVAAIEESLGEPAEFASRRQEAVRLHSWSQRVAQKLRLIEERLAEAPDPRVRADPGGQHLLLRLG